jgi:hypothetical protein
MSVLNLPQSNAAIDCLSVWPRIASFAMSTMRAMLIEEADGPLVLREIPIPEPGPGEVLLRVRACAVDRFDLAIRSGVR